MQQPNESNEIALLETVELKLGLAASEDKLQGLLKVFLVPVLKKLASPNEAVRQKVIGMCSHITQRLKGSQVILPVEQLLELFTSSSNNALVAHFALVFIELGISKADAEIREKALPIMLLKLASRPVSQQKILLFLAFPIMAKLEDTYKLELEDGGWELLASKIVDVMLFTPVVAPAIPPGLSNDALQFITNGGKAEWAKSGSELLNLKLGLVHFCLNILPDSFRVERYLVFIAASVDTNTQVQQAAEDASKKVHKPEFESEIFINALYSLYLGSKSAVSNGAADRSQGSLNMKTKVLMNLSKSIRAANKFPQALQVVFDSLYGNGSNHKLRAQGMGFLHWISRMSAEENIRPVAPVLLSGLLKFIDEQDRSTMDAATLRSYAFEAMGLLSKRAPKVFAEDITVIQNLFDSIPNEEPVVRSSIMSALTSMQSAYKQSNDATLGIIKALITSNLSSKEQDARLSAVRYANNLFPFSDSFSRFVCLLLSVDVNGNVREESRRGLTFPMWVAAELSEEEYRAKLPGFGEFTELLDAEIVKVANKGAPLGISSDAYLNAIIFSRKLLVIGSDPSSRPMIDLGDVVNAPSQSSGTDSLGSSLSELSKIANFETREKVRKNIRTLWDDNTSNDAARATGLQQYLILLLRALESESDSSVHSAALFCLVELLSFCGEQFIATFKSHLALIKRFLKSSKMETRSSAAHVIGLVSTALDAPALNTLLSELVETVREALPHSTQSSGSTAQMSSTSLEVVHGACLAIGYVIGRHFYIHSNAPVILADLTREGIISVVNCLIQPSSLIITSSLGALGEIGRYSNILFQNLPHDGSHCMTNVIKKIQELAKSNKDPKLQEAAVTALGHIGVGNGLTSIADVTLGETILNSFYSMADSSSKQVDLQFSIAESVCMIAGGWTSVNLMEFADLADAEIPSVTEDIRQKLLEQVLLKLFELMGGVPLSDNPPKPPGPAHIRKSISIWLMVISKFMGRSEVVLRYIAQIHAAFINLLTTSRDELVQDCASKGISFVYNLGGDEMKRELVQALASTLMDGKKIAPQSVTADTTIFEPGTIGTAPDGSAITTYQSILSLATEVGAGQSDFIYRVMNLASHQATWSARHAASLGFASIASESEEHLKPLLPKLIPKLYRYQYDPNPKVQSAMQRIWQTLVKDPQKAVEEYWNEIFDDLMVFVGHKEWRNREASAKAITSLLQGPSVAQQLPQRLEPVWIMCFRLLDDIKESVRQAGFLLYKSLTTVTLKLIDPESMSKVNGQKVADMIIPLFLKYGLGSMAEEVQKFSLASLLKIIKTAKMFIKPHVVELVSTLLESLSVLEPQVMNYLTFHVDKYEISESQLDNMRLQATKSSPVIEALDSMLIQVDGDVMKELAPRIAQIIKRATGLPSKAGCARFIASLAKRAPTDTKPYADMFLQSLRTGLRDPSTAVQKLYAVAIGQVCFVANSATLESFIKELKAMSLDTEANSYRTAAVVFIEMAKHAKDQIVQYRDEILPLSFLFSHTLATTSAAADESDAELWQTVFEEVSGGSKSSALQLYTSEVILFLKDILTSSPSWGLRAKVGAAFADLVDTLGDKVIDVVEQLNTVLEDALQGRTWDGKGEVFRAFCTLCVKARWWYDDKKIENVMKIFVREAKKKNVPYTTVVFRQIGFVFDALSLTYWNSIWPVMEIALASEDEHDGDSAKAFRELQCAIFEAIGLCWPKNDEAIQIQYGAAIVETLCDVGPKHIVGRKYMFKSLRTVISKVTIPIDPASANKILSSALQYGLNDAKHAEIREISTGIVKELVKKLADDVSAGANNKQLHLDLLKQCERVILQDPTAPDETKNLLRDFIAKST
ncbi:proteasome stabiliser-domain-containing protein [Cladochytrium replicatum]|nr:proteasome stabiliser-domain-containing protein [Cladochytrium replicatum]